MNTNINNVSDSSTSIFESEFPKVTPDYQVVVSQEEWDVCFESRKNKKRYLRICIGVFAVVFIGLIAYLSPHLMNTQHHAELTHATEKKSHGSDMKEPAGAVYK